MTGRTEAIWRFESICLEPPIQRFGNKNVGQENRIRHPARYCYFAVRHFPVFSIFDTHSSRSAMFGSSLAARRAGNPDATEAMIKKSAAMAVKVAGSVALTPT